MIEKIGTDQYRAVSDPCKEFLELIQNYTCGGVRTVAEIGVGIGATAIEVAKLLDENDQYYIFSYLNDVLELESDLKRVGCKCKIHALGNTTKTYDSYNWSLANLYLNSDNKELFDVVYLDGAHSFFHDSTACCLLKMMTKKNGIIIFDDIDWCHKVSPTANPNINPQTSINYTQEQIETCQVAMVIDIFMKNDPGWEMLKDFSSKNRATYRKI